MEFFKEQHWPSLRVNLALCISITEFDAKIRHVIRPFSSDMSLEALSKLRRPGA